MIAQRPQGRPCRGGNEVGKIKIVESLREMLRTFPGEHVSRKRLAEFAGVTPALITYYFPAKDGLIKEATLPVIEAHAEQLHAILTGPDEAFVRLRNAVKYLLTFYSRDAGILWVYRTLSKENKSQKLDYLTQMSDELEAFMKEHRFETGTWPSRAMVLQGALWGIVQFVAEAKMLDLMTSELERNQGMLPIVDDFVGALQARAAPHYGLV